MKARTGFLALLSMLAHTALAQSLTWVSNVPDTLVYAMNSNATVLVGYCTSAPYAFRWTRATGERALPTPPGTIAVMARGVSEDGTVIAGCYAAIGDQGWKPIVWRIRGNTITYQLLPLPSDVPSGVSYLVQGISGDGRLIAAEIQTAYGGCYWLDGQVYRLPPAVRGVQGVTRTGIIFDDYRWTLERGIERLPIPAWCLTPDGRFGAGGAFNNQVLYFDPCGGVSLGSAPNGGFGGGTAISDDGRIVVGYQRNVGAIRWRRENGFLDGAYLIFAQAISADGRYIAGQAALGQRRAFLLDTNGR
jgi:hypothetical protein